MYKFYTVNELWPSRFYYDKIHHIGQAIAYGQLVQIFYTLIILVDILLINGDIFL